MTWCALHDGAPTVLRQDLHRVAAAFARLPDGERLEAEFDNAVMDVVDPIRDQYLVVARAYVQYQRLVLNAVESQLADPVHEIATSARLRTLEAETDLLVAEVERREALRLRVAAQRARQAELGALGVVAAEAVAAEAEAVGGAPDTIVVDEEF